MSARASRPARVRGIGVRGCVALTASLAVLPSPAAAQDLVTVTVAATTDVHGHVYQWDYVNDRPASWGLTRVATVLDSLRRNAPGPVIVVDAGDMIQGNPFAAYYRQTRRPVNPIIDAMNAMQYDVFTPGNHEFNFGVGYLDSILGEAQFQVVSGNIYRSAWDALAHPESALLNRGGVRIGVTGFTTPGAMVWDRQLLQGVIDVRPVPPEAERALANMVRDGADLKVVLIHSGMDGPSSYDDTSVGAENVAASLARLPTRPDLVVVGHSHRTMADSTINGVHFMQPRQWAQGVAVARVTMVRRPEGGYRVRDIHSEVIPVDRVAPSTLVARRVESAHDAVRAWLNRPVATATATWSARFARAGDTPLIDFVNEVQRRRAGAQLSATAAFDTDASIQQGDVRRRDIMGVYPYENTLKAIRIDGATLAAFLEHSATYFNTLGSPGGIVNRAVPGYNFDIVSGVDYVIDLSQPVGSRIRQLSYQGRLVSAADTFTMALNHYRQGGGGNYDMLVGLPVVYDRSENVRDLLVAEVERAQVLQTDAYYRPSWRLAPAAAEQAVRAEFGEAAPPVTDRTVLRVLSITDFHGALTPRITPWSEGRRVGGVAAMDSWLDSLAGRCACTTIRVAAGDQLRGSLPADRAFGRPVVQALNGMAFDAVVPGPDDFAMGLDTFRVRVAESAFPWVAANVELARGGRPDWLYDWVLLERDGKNIAVVGVADDQTPPPFATDPTLALRFTDPVAAVQRTLGVLAGGEFDAVVVVAHLPAVCETTSCEGRLIDFVRALPAGGVDLVVGGHSDAEAAATINGIPVVLPGSFGITVGSSDVIERARGGREVETQVATVWQDSVTANLNLTLAAAGDTDAAELDRRVTEVRFAMAGGPEADSPYGNLLADAYRNATRAHVALVMNGDVGAGLAAGPHTLRSLYQAQPVRRQLMRVTVDGRTVKAVLEDLLRDGTPAAHVSGLRIEYDLRRDPGDRVRRIEFPDGARMRDDQSYVLGVSLRVAVGAEGTTRLRGRPAADAQVSDFDALVTYLSRLPSPVEAPRDKRFRID